MYENDIFCLICSEPVATPICVSCLTREIIAWMGDKNVPGGRFREIINQMGDFTLQSPEKSLSYSECILCHKPCVSICPVCFFDYSLSILRENGVRGKLVKELSTILDFEYSL